MGTPSLGSEKMARFAAPLWVAGPVAAAQLRAQPRAVRCRWRMQKATKAKQKKGRACSLLMRGYVPGNGKHLKWGSV